MGTQPHRQSQPRTKTSTARYPEVNRSDEDSATARVTTDPQLRNIVPSTRRSHASAPSRVASMPNPAAVPKKSRRKVKTRHGGHKSNAVCGCNRNAASPAPPAPVRQQPLTATRRPLPPGQRSSLAVRRASSGAQRWWWTQPGMTGHDTSARWQRVLPRTHFQLLAWACPRTAWVVATRSSAVFCAVRAAASCSFSSLALCKGKHGHSKMANSTNTEIQPPATTTTTTTPSATRPAAPSACPQPQQRQRAPSPAASIASPPVFTTHTRASTSQPGQGPFTPPPTTTPHACKHTALAVAKFAVSSLTLSSRAAVA